MKVHILTKDEMAMQKLNILFLEIASIPVEYPPALLAARRAGFVKQIQAFDPDAVDIATPSVSEHQDERNSRPAPF